MNAIPALNNAPAAAVAALPPVYPLSAILGQDELVLALLLAAVEPALGGLLIQGPRGTAKSTGARALADVLAPAPFVGLPLAASLEHVVGSLDLSKALANNELAFAPGLLAKANGGVLYVDEINLLPDALVDVLLDVAASGVNRIERDGISHSHAARFVLIGTMNPEEGALRPQLLDRMGLCVQLANVQDSAVRAQIVKTRLQFDLNPAAFTAAFAEQQSLLTAQLQQARARCANPADLPWTDDVYDAVATQCIAAQVDGLRADLVMLRAARALAAWQGGEAIDVAHVLTVAPLVLRHRASRERVAQRTQTPHASQAGANTPAAAQSAPNTQAQTRAEPAMGRRSDAAPQPSGAQSAWESAPPGGHGAGQAKATPSGEPGLAADRGSLAPDLKVASQAVAEGHAEALALEAMEAIAAKKARASSTRR